MKRNYTLTGMVLLASLVLLGLLLVETEPEAPVMAVTEEPSPPEIVSTITLASVGDIMAHMPQVNAAFDSQLGVYDFTPCFASIRPLLSEVDLAVANLETTLTGADHGYSGYPRFNSPPELAAAIEWAGFDLVSTANNHSLDRGEQGVLRTIEHLANNELVAVGTYRSWEERQKIVMLENAGQNLAFLAYTYGTNGIPFPEGKEYLVKLIDPEEMTEDIAQARECGADWIIVLLHFGNEYQRSPSEEQRELADFLFAQGADIILGSHPHVLQPVEWEKDRVVAFSQGNFISNQRDPFRDSGMILFLTLEKNITRGERQLKQVEYIPTWVHRYQAEDGLQYRVLPVEGAVRTYEMGEDLYLSGHDYRRLQEVWEETNDWVSPGGRVRARTVVEG